MKLAFNLDYAPPLQVREEHGIGILGSGFIVRECHLPAYRDAGYSVRAIASRTEANARRVAEAFGIPKTYATVDEMLDDPDVSVIDVAYPPHAQPDVVRQAARRGKHVLAQKPLATSYQEAVALVEACEEAGIYLAVNQNGRYDPTIQAAKNLLDQGLIGEPIVATIELRFTPHWQQFIKDYDRLMFLNMSIHHLDQFRYLFGPPDRLFASATTYPGSPYKGEYIGMYILEYDKGLRASAWDDGFTWDPPGFGVFYKIEGTEGVIRSKVGWPSGGPSEMTFYSKKLGDAWITPTLEGSWFPGAFKYTMGFLLQAIERGEEPPHSGRENLLTMAMVEACYRSVEERRSVALDEIVQGGTQRAG